ncbi:MULTISPECIES: hypothetical protein [Streptomyces]|uniref:hypothetical protein n=1 Tax=Streptomyces TaxID=1883 RepID=UPI001F39FF67|nr:MULTISPECIES: hypothetical protein [Streptomyces]
MKRLTTRAATTGAALGLAMVGLIAVPSPASAAAATKCTGEQHKTYDTIGANLDVYVDLCVSRTSSNNYQATVRFRWSDGGGGLSTGMDKLKVNLRLERNDTAHRTASADYAAATNAFQSGNRGFSTTTFHSTTTGGWTADGTIDWDINNDGTGGGTTQLQGSGEI